MKRGREVEGRERQGERERRGEDRRGERERERELIMDMSCNKPHARERVLVRFAYESVHDHFIRSCPMQLHLGSVDSQNVGCSDTTNTAMQSEIARLCIGQSAEAQDKFSSANAPECPGIARVFAITIANCHRMPEIKAPAPWRSKRCCDFNV